MSKAISKRQIGRTSLSVTELGMGGTPLGNMYKAMETEAALRFTRRRRRASAISTRLLFTASASARRGLVKASRNCRARIS
jgi:hypothetical protein